MQQHTYLQVKTPENAMLTRVFNLVGWLVCVLYDLLLRIS